MIQQSSQEGMGMFSSALRISIKNVTPRSSQAALFTCRRALNAVMRVRITLETERSWSYTRSR